MSYLSVKAVKSEDFPSPLSYGIKGVIIYLTPPCYIRKWILKQLYLNQFKPDQYHLVSYVMKKYILSPHETHQNLYFVIIYS